MTTLIELDEIKECQRQAAAEIAPEPFAPDAVMSLVQVESLRLIAAVDAVLKAAASWKQYAAEGDALDLAADEVRKVISRELLGEAGDDR
jgi:hypothetical protein